jgi:hypothetical protein
MSDLQFRKAKLKSLNKKTWDLLKMQNAGHAEYIDLRTNQKLAIDEADILEGPSISTRLALYLLSQNNQKRR